MIYDVGSDLETGSSKPEGCKGKIDFLFVISRLMGSVNEGTVYDSLVAAAPSFFATIETKFADFDYHILVTDGDPTWGSGMCNDECPGPFMSCKVPDEYPCDALGHLSSCDLTWGAGVVFNAGWLAPNKPCEVAGGKRYIAKGQPNLAETFSCLARVGGSGYDLIGQALTAAVSPELRAPGGCNEGFLRDDALLVVTRRPRARGRPRARDLEKHPDRPPEPGQDRRLDRPRRAAAGRRAEGPRPHADRRFRLRLRQARRARRVRGPGRSPG